MSRSDRGSLPQIPHVTPYPTSEIREHDRELRRRRAWLVKMDGWLQRLLRVQP